MFLRRVFGYEKSRIKNDKTLFAVTIAVFLTAVLVFFLFCALSPAESVQVIDDREAEKITYMKYISESEYALNSPNLTDSQRTELQLNIEKYKFYLETDTVESDYLPIDNFTGKFNSYTFSSAMLSFAHFSFYPFCVLSVMGGIYLVGQERDKNILKNILAPDIPRKKLYASKLSISLIMTFAPVVIFMIVLGVIGAFVPHGTFLVYSGGYKPLNGFSLYWQIILGNFSAQLLLYSVSALLCLFFKRLYSVAFTAVGYLFFAVLGMVVQNEDKFVRLNIQTFESFVCFPVVGIQNYSSGLDIVFCCVFLAHLAAAAAAIVISFKIFEKRELI